MNNSEIEKMKEEAGNEMKKAMLELENDVPGITEGLAALLGSAAGGAASFAALTTLGVAGLSAAGITSGLAAAGALIGGGMVAGIGVLAAPIALLGIGGYALAKSKKKAKAIAALNTAIEKLYKIQKRLAENAEYFKSEIAQLTSMIDIFQVKLKKQQG